MTTALETMKENRDDAVREAERFEGYIADMSKTIERYRREADEARKTAAAYQVAINALTAGQEADRG